MFVLGVLVVAGLLESSRADFPGACESNPTRCSCIYTDTVSKKKMIYDLEPVSNSDGSFRLDLPSYPLHEQELFSLIML